MIYCVTFENVVDHLKANGFAFVGTAEPNTLFSVGGAIVTLHQPNQHGDITLIEIESAFDAAGLTVPAFDLHWCD